MQALQHDLSYHLFAQWLEEALLLCGLAFSSATILQISIILKYTYASNQNGLYHILTITQTFSVLLSIFHFSWVLFNFRE